MENLVVFSINMLLIMAIWFFCFKPAVKARKKLELALLKKEVNNFFSHLPKSKQNSEMQKKLIAVVSDTEVTLDQISLSAYIAWTIEVEKNKELSEALDQEISEKFYTKDESLKVFISKIRNEASMIGIGYMIQSSFFLLVLGAFISVCMFFKDIAKKGAVTLGDFKPKLESSAEKIFKTDFIEQKSLFSTKIC